MEDTFLAPLSFSRDDPLLCVGAQASPRVPPLFGQEKKEEKKRKKKKKKGKKKEKKSFLSPISLPSLYLTHGPYYGFDMIFSEKSGFVLLSMQFVNPSMALTINL